MIVSSCQLILFGSYLLFHPLWAIVKFKCKYNRYTAVHWENRQQYICFDFYRCEMLWGKNEENVWNSFPRYLWLKYDKYFYFQLKNHSVHNCSEFFHSITIKNESMNRCNSIDSEKEREKEIRMYCKPSFIDNFCCCCLHWHQSPFIYMCELQRQVELWH